MLIDTHCHLDFPEFDRDRDNVIREANEKGIGRIINIGSSMEGSRRSVELAAKYACLFATIGIHPHEADSFDEGCCTSLKQLLKAQKIVAIGEIGLDYFKNYSKAENQRRLFKSLLALAKESNLPVVLHSRQAEKDTLEILKDFLPLKAVVHCFSGSRDFLSECLRLGLFVSFTCNVTYKKAENLRALVVQTPLERLFLETDAPFLSPEGWRGKRNEPSQIKLLAEEISGIKNIPIEKIESVTTKNAEDFFNLQ